MEAVEEAWIVEVEVEVEAEKEAILEDMVEDAVVHSILKHSDTRRFFNTTPLAVSRFTPLSMYQRWY